MKIIKKIGSRNADRTQDQTNIEKLALLRIWTNVHQKISYQFDQSAKRISDTVSLLCLSLTQIFYLVTQTIDIWSIVLFQCLFQWSFISYKSDGWLNLISLKMIKISKIFVVINLVSSRSDFDDVPKEANPFVKSFIAPRLDFPY